MCIKAQVLQKILFRLRVWFCKQKFATFWQITPATMYTLAIILSIIDRLGLQCHETWLTKLGPNASTILKSEAILIKNIKIASWLAPNPLRSGYKARKSIFSSKMINPICAITVSLYHDIVVLWYLDIMILGCYDIAISWYCNIIIL